MTIKSSEAVGAAPRPGTTMPGAVAGPAPHVQDWPDHGLSRRQVMITLAGVMLAMFMAALDQTIVGTAMPRIIGDLGGFDRYTWVTSSYIVASTAIVPIVGRLGDLYGRKWLYVFGLSVFLLGSVLSAVSASMNALIAARAIQGLGGGTMMALSFVVISDLFPPAERGKYQGLIAGMFGISSVIGPALGGFLTDNLSWHWVFWVNIPLGIPVIGLFLRLFPDMKRAKATGGIDYAGAALMVVGIVALLLGLSWAGVDHDWLASRVVMALAVGALTLVVFTVYEVRVKDPMMPIKLFFTNRTIAVLLIAGFFVGFAMFGAIIFLPLFFQGVKGASATSSGGVTTPMSLSIVLGATLSGQALSRLGGHYKIQALLGVGLMVAGAVLLSTIDANTSWTRAILGAMLIGFGLGNTFPVFTIAVQNAVPFQQMGVATTATQFFRQVGGSVGLAVLGSLMVTGFATGFVKDVPADAAQALSPARVEAMSKNPNALVSEQGQAQLQQGLAPLGDRAGAAYQGTINALKVSLAHAIARVFLVSVFMLGAAWALLWLLKEMPLRRSAGRGGRAAPPGPERPGAAFPPAH